MDIQVLNEIANQARQASFSQARFPVSANAQVKTLKGNPATPTVEDSLGQGQEPGTPDISSVARAASVYSAAVGDGLNSDELNAIQNLAGKVRSAVSEFLNQPDLGQASNAAAVVALNTEAVQDLISGVEQAVEETFIAQGTGDEATVTVEPPKASLSPKDIALESLVSLERITNGAKPNNPVEANNLAAVNLPASENVKVENPVANIPESSRGDFRVTSASPILENAPVTENAQVETPVAVAESPRRSVNPPEAAAVPQEPASVPKTVATDQQEEVPVAAVASPASQNVSAPENTRAQTPVNRPIEVPPQKPVNPPEAAVVSQEPASVPKTVATDQQEEAPVAAVVSPASQNVPVPENTRAQTPVSRPVAIPGASEEGAAQIVNSEEVVVLSEGERAQGASGQPNPQPLPSPQPGPAQVNDLFAQENGTVNPENVRDVNELVNSVVSNEFTSEAKKIFSEPKVIRTVADLADFILERLREIIAAKQQQPSSDNEVGIS